MLSEIVSRKSSTILLYYKYHQHTLTRALVMLHYSSTICGACRGADVLGPSFILDKGLSSSPWREHWTYTDLTSHGKVNQGHYDKTVKVYNLCKIRDCKRIRAILQDYGRQPAFKSCTHNTQVLHTQLEEFSLYFCLLSCLRWAIILLINTCRQIKVW